MMASNTGAALQMQMQPGAPQAQANPLANDSIILSIISDGLKVVELQKVLRTVGARSTGNKSLLQERLLECYNSNTVKVGSIIKEFVRRKSQLHTLPPFQIRPAPGYQLPRPNLPMYSPYANARPQSMFGIPNFMPNTITGPPQPQVVPQPLPPPPPPHQPLPRIPIPTNDLHRPGIVDFNRPSSLFSTSSFGTLHPSIAPKIMPNFTILPTPIIPTTPIVISPNVFFRDISILHTVRVGHNFAKPPLIFKLALSDAHTRLLEIEDPISKQRLHRIVIVCVKVPPITTLPMKGVEFPGASSLYLNNIVFPIPQNVNPMGVDITSKWKLRHSNEVKFSFYNSPTNYILMVKLVRNLSPEEMVTEIKQKRISKEQVISTRLNSAKGDDDIVAGNETLALHDPYTRCRISVPIRSYRCKHLQCYDASTFIQMCRKSQRYECPICYQRVTMTDMIVDGFFQDILGNTKESDSHVNVLAHDCSWKLKVDEVLASSSSNVSLDKKQHEVFCIDDDDDAPPPPPPSSHFTPTAALKTPSPAVPAPVPAPAPASGSGGGGSGSGSGGAGGSSSSGRSNGGKPEIIYIEID